MPGLQACLFVTDLGQAQTAHAEHGSSRTPAWSWRYSSARIRRSAPDRRAPSGWQCH